MAIDKQLAEYTEREKMVNLLTQNSISDSIEPPKKKPGVIYLHHNKTENQEQYVQSARKMFVASPPQYHAKCLIIDKTIKIVLRTSIFFIFVR